MVFAKRLRLPAICLLTVAANPSHALAWSDLGHKVVCEIAYTPSSLVEMMITLDGANTKIAFDANDSVTLTGFVRTIGQACSVVQSGATGSKCCVIMSGRAGPGRFRPPGMKWGRFGKGLQVISLAPFDKELVMFLDHRQCHLKGHQ